MQRSIADDAAWTVMPGWSARRRQPAAVDQKLVERLERTGVITGYRVDIDPAAPGMPITACARIHAAAGQLVRVAGLGQSMRHVSEGRRITGEDCFSAEGARRLDGAAR